MMENNIRFRNHASIILENSLKAITSIIAIFFLNMISDIGKEDFSFTDVLILAAILAGFMLIILGIQAILWAKTYIIIEENTLVVERSTLNKNRNTIGLKSISNVNLEQNLLEMILGTCKVKLDTDSLSTADQTDVNIVLKKDKAENFRKLVLARAAGVSEDIYVSKEAEEESGIIGSVSDLVLHGLFSVRIFNLAVMIGLIVVSVVLYQDEGMPPIDTLFTIVCFFSMSAWATVKEFIKYINFRIERKQDKVYLNYGLFKKVAYSVPVDKINAIRLNQTPIARMAKRYMVEIINVGMDDDEKETNSFFLPYSKLETIREQMHILLPEFDGALEIKEKKQPAAIWLLSIPWLILYVVIVAIAYGIVATYMPESDLKDAIVFAAVVIFIWRTFTKLIRFLIRGIKVDEQYLKIVEGGLAKIILIVKYDKIQYVTGKQCVIAKHFKMQKGTISLLASMANRIHELPYFAEEDMELLKNKLIE